MQLFRKKHQSGLVWLKSCKNEGKSIAKVFGKEDTFETYQASTVTSTPPLGPRLLLLVANLAHARSTSVPTSRAARRRIRCRKTVAETTVVASHRPHDAELQELLTRAEAHPRNLLDPPGTA